MKATITSSSIRHFPNTPPPKKGLASIDAALNERFSFQLAAQSDTECRFAVTAEAPDGWNLRIRHVGLVPMPHHNTGMLEDPEDTDGIGHIPGLVPDPLFDETEAFAGPGETVSFWFSVTPPPDAKPGKYSISAIITPNDRWDGTKPGGKPIKRTVGITLHDLRIKPRSGFDVTHWFYSDCIIQRYGTDLFDERYWSLLEKYLDDIAQHGQNVIYVPLFTPPLDTDKLPSQLLKVTRKGGNRYAFDWSDVRRYVRTAKKCGISKFEWCHFFGQWGCKYALRIYEGQGKSEKLLWPKETPATDKAYRTFLEQLLPEFRAFLNEERILKKSLFHISDEPNGEEAKRNYLAAKTMMRELAPWMEFCDAVSHIDYGKEGVIDIPVPTIATALEFLDAGIDSWCYYCCGPRGAYLQHLLDTPLAKIAMHGFVFYRWPFKGFLHWGLNYWSKSQTRIPIDPFAVSDGDAWQSGWAYGDTFLVYPGENGPIDSIRWEVFAEAMQDYALLQTLGVAKDDPLLRPIKSFKDFPKAASWRTAMRKKLFALKKSTSTAL